MGNFRFYISPSYLRLFSVGVSTSIKDLWQKRNERYGGQKEEDFRLKNPKSYAEIHRAWDILTDPEVSPYGILGVSKDTPTEHLKTAYIDLVRSFPLLLCPEVNQKISEALALLLDAERRIFIDFFTFDHNLWHLCLLEGENEIEVRREIETQYSGSTHKQIINSTLFCYLKACHIEETGGDIEKASPSWKKAFLGWQGILQEDFIWEELRTRVKEVYLFSDSPVARFDDDSIERVKKRLKNLLIENSLERCIAALKHSVEATLVHLNFLKYFRIEEPAQRTAIARIYNQCAYLVSREGRLEEAVRLLEEALRLDENLTEAKTNIELAHTGTSGIGMTLRLLSQKKEKEALQLLQEIVRSNPQDSDAKELLATLLHKLAHNAFREENYDEAFIHLSEASRYREDYKAELEIVSRAKQNNDLQNALHYLKDKQYEQTARILQDYLKLYPEREAPKHLLARVFNHLAIQKKHQRLWTEARDYVKQALSLEPHNEVFQANLACVEKAAENQQLAKDITIAVNAIEGHKPQEAIDILQPIYTTQALPPTIKSEIRGVLGSAYLALGISTAREAENAVSRGAIKEAFEAAHLALTIADYVHSTEETRQNLSMLEEALPELAEREYDVSKFPEPPGGRKRPLPSRHRLRMWRKIRRNLRSPLEFLRRMQVTPALIPVSFLTLVVISILLFGGPGKGMFLPVLFALFIQISLTAFTIARTHIERSKILLSAGIIAILLAAGDLGWILSHRPTPSVEIARAAKPTPPLTPALTPTPAPTEPPRVSPTPFPKPPKGRGIFHPLLTFGQKFARKAEMVSMARATSIPPPTMSPTPTPLPTPTKRPSRVGRRIEIGFTIQDFIGVRQTPTLAFIYRINTAEGPATLILDPLVYIKTPKEKLREKKWLKAKVKVLQDIGQNIYALEGPSDLRSSEIKPQIQP